MRTVVYLFVAIATMAFVSCGQGKQDADQAKQDSIAKADSMRNAINVKARVCRVMLINING